MDTLTEMQSKSVEIAERIIQENYYTHIFEKILASKDLTLESIQSLNRLSDGILYVLWNQFWASLPDSRSIRRDPFFAVCDLAEGNYMTPEGDN